MRTDEIERARGALDEVIVEVFSLLGRKGQRGKDGLYLQGLMLEGQRTSMQPMGARLGFDHQWLQQVVSSSPCPVDPVRRIWAHKAVDLLDPVVWVIDDIGFPKDGPASPGVAHWVLLRKSMLKGVAVTHNKATPV